MRNGRSGQPWAEENPEDVLEIKRLMLLELDFCRLLFEIKN